MTVKRLENAIVGCMATSPARFATLAPVIAAIAPQLDHLYIYVDETTDGFPDVSHLENISVLDGRDHRGDLSDNGKIYPLEFLSGCTVFTLDDSLVFADDYVSTCLDLLAKFDGKCAVTAHGGILPPKVDWYGERTLEMPATQAVAALSLCALADSGTFCFDQKTFQCDPEDFLSDPMVDLRLSILARMQGLPIWVVPRSEGWLQSVETDNPSETDSNAALTHHTDFARGFDWSFDIYRTMANTAIAEAGIDVTELGLEADLQNSLQTGTVPKSWATSETTLLNRIAYMDILLQS